MVCGRCGHRNDPDARFCSSCGAPLPGGDETTQGHVAVAREVEDRAVAELAPGTGLLVVDRGPNAGSSYLLDQDEVALGRHPESQVFLDDITVSRRHSVIERVGGAFRIRDVGSLNGTYVNRDRVEEAPLVDGDEVQVGRFHLTFRTGS
jgi:pSer/pThr/pTyr-binding forkhead associated (FHA) protein